MCMHNIYMDNTNSLSMDNHYEMGPISNPTKRYLCQSIREDAYLQMLIRYIKIAS